MFDPISVVISLISLGVAFRALEYSKRRLLLQSETHDLTKADLAAKRQPRLQISNETFLSSWQTTEPAERGAPEDIEFYYTAQMTNKGESTTTIESIIIEIAPAQSPLAEPGFGLGVVITGPVYLEKSESIALEKTIPAQTITLTRMFFEGFEGVLVFTLVYKYLDHAGITIKKSYEIYRINNQGGIVSKGDYNAAKGEPRSYLLQAT